MNNQVYCIYNRLSQRYGDVCCFPTDAYAVNFIRNQTGEKFDEYVKECELCNIGVIDITSGVATFRSPVRVDWNLTLQQEINSL
ncbi:hypothetical protein [Tortoise microvirus 67]|nr:hypothetical protein [Tortoise microvirus 67]